MTTHTERCCCGSLSLSSLVSFFFRMRSFSFRWPLVSRIVLFNKADCWLMSQSNVLCVWISFRDIAKSQPQANYLAVISSTQFLGKSSWAIFFFWLESLHHTRRWNFNAKALHVSISRATSWLLIYWAHSQPLLVLLSARFCNYLLSL